MADPMGFFWRRRAPATPQQLRVLYAVYHPLPLSESYIRNEIEWMEAHGVRIGIWAHDPRLAQGYPDPGREYWEGLPAFRKAVRSLRPSVVHAHPLFIAEAVADEVERLRLPLTVRGHVGFGGKEKDAPEAIRKFAQRAVVSRIWVFPHFCEDVAHPKVAPLPACYAAGHFNPHEPDDLERTVLRIGTGLPGKGWEEFLEVARRCPEARFVAALAVPHRAYADQFVRAAPSNVEIRLDAQREQCVALMRSAWIYLRGHDPGSHRYGMPISIGEALGCGLPVIARDAPEARTFIGPAGSFYTTPEQATALVKTMRGWPRARWNAAREVSLAQAKRYAADSNLGAVLDHWMNLAAAG